MTCRQGFDCPLWPPLPPSPLEGRRLGSAPPAHPTPRRFACLLESGGLDGQLHVASAVDRATVAHPVRRRGELCDTVAIELGRLEQGAGTVLRGRKIGSWSFEGF